MGLFRSLGRKAESVRRSLAGEECPSCEAAVDDDDDACPRCGAALRSGG